MNICSVHIATPAMTSKSFADCIDLVRLRIGFVDRQMNNCFAYIGCLMSSDGTITLDKCAVLTFLSGVFVTWSRGPDYISVAEALGLVLSSETKNGVYYRDNADQFLFVKVCILCFCYVVSGLVLIYFDNVVLF